MSLAAALHHLMSECDSGRGLRLAGPLDSGMMKESFILTRSPKHPDRFHGS